MTYRNRKIHTERPRRGVTLLLVLGLMTMFAMLVVTFMVVTTQAMKTSESVAGVALKYTGVTNLDSIGSGKKSLPTPDFDRAVDGLLVGGLDTVIGPHSILENLYGEPNYFSGGMFGGMLEYDSGPAVTILSTNDLIEVELTLSSGSFSAITFDVVGHVLTAKVPNSPKSTVIVKSEVGPNSQSLIVHVAPFENDTVANTAAILKAHGCFLNSPAFGGTGPGYYRDSSYSAGTPLLALKDEDLDNDGGYTNAGSPNGFPLALRPNILAPENDGVQKYKKYLYNNRVLVNPDYTAPDYQTMFLAWDDVIASGGNYYIDGVIPSFHRPSLVRYCNPQNATDLRKIVLRPLRQDHPNFSGSNPAASGSSLTDEVTFLTQGPWDVDNDGDGIQDGIWLDLGAEAQQIDGKWYKPLYSFYVRDMDGRLNVNAHGMETHRPNGNAVDAATGGLTDTYGSGSGVAEIRLNEGLAVVSTSSQVKDLLEGTSDHTGRYNGDKEPGDDTATDTSLTGGNDLVSTMGIWYGAFATPGNGGSYTGYGAMQPDFWATSAMKFDPLGNRMFDTSSNPFFAQNPYMMNPFYKDAAMSTAPDDSPFKGEDLEFLLRSVGDKDFHEVLSTTRLRYLIDANDGVGNPEKFSKYRHFVTNQSTDIPAASRAGLDGYGGIIKYIAATLFGYDDSKSEDDPDNVQPLKDTNDFARLLPPELLRGEKVNLDRIMHLDASLQGASNRKVLLREKSRFAQEMFYLMMTLCHNEVTTTKDITRVAQWCVNLVDFLDADDVMTPLVFHETDPLNNPYDLTEIKGDGTDVFDSFYSNSGSTFTLPTDHRLVWGMEQPEVALTKTFATHNRRVANSKYGVDVPGANRQDPARNRLHSEIAAEHNAVPGNTPKCSGTNCHVHMNRYIMGCNCGADPSMHHHHDQSFDQVMVPQGSLFLELYRLGNPNRTYYKKGDADGLLDGTQTTESELDLSKIADGKSPVWRLAIGKASRMKPEESANDNSIFEGLKTKEVTYDFQPKQSLGTPDGSAECQVELGRFIWFCDESKVSDGDIKKNSYFNVGNENGPATAGNKLLLRTNEYLVIGPRLFTSFLSLPVKEESGTDGTPKPDPVGKAIAKEFGDPDTSEDTYIDLPDIAGLGGPSRVKVMVAAAKRSGGGEASQLGKGMEGIGVSVSEPLPNGGKYYPVPTGDASAKMKTRSHLSDGGNFKDKYIDQAECNTVMKTFIEDDKELEAGIGTIAGFRSIFLQRLADPGREHNENTNPYITVDWNMIDLHVFNSEEDLGASSADPEPDIRSDFNKKLYFTLRQWGRSAAPTTPPSRPNIWDRAFDSSKINGIEDGLDVTGSTDIKMHKVVLGQYGDGTGVSGGTGDYLGAPDKSFVHFPWNNGPLSNTFELMLVPASSPSRFGFEFHEAGISNWWTLANSLGTNGQMLFFNEDANVGPYFNFFKTDGGASNPNLSRLFDFVRVPSKFNGSVRGIVNESLPAGGTWVYPASRMREPGKINLNTANEATWESLKMDSSGFPNYTVFRQALTTAGGAWTLPTEIPYPIRSAASGDLVPVSGLQYGAVNPSIVRKLGGSNDPIFKPHGSSKSTNQRTALEDAMRRSDMVTNRSNVFAVWVTIGYFEVEKFGGIGDLNAEYSTKLAHVNANNFAAIYPDGCVLGKEKGVHDGSVTRNRHFYLIDRSVPVGFRRGERLNSRDVILHERRLE